RLPIRSCRQKLARRRCSGAASCSSFCQRYSGRGSWLASLVLRQLLGRSDEAPLPSVMLHTTKTEALQLTTIGGCRSPLPSIPSQLPLPNANPESKPSLDKSSDSLDHCALGRSVS